MTQFSLRPKERLLIFNFHVQRCTRHFTLKLTSILHLSPALSTHTRLLIVPRFWKAFRFRFDWLRSIDNAARPPTWPPGHRVTQQHGSADLTIMIPQLDLPISKQFRYSSRKRGLTSAKLHQSFLNGFLVIQYIYDFHWNIKILHLSSHNHTRSSFLNNKRLGDVHIDESQKRK